MTHKIKLLEELVVEAVARLRDLSRDRQELRTEVDALRERLDAQTAPQGRSEDESAGLEARRAEAIAAVREALSELRDGGSAGR